MESLHSPLFDIGVGLVIVHSSPVPPLFALAFSHGRTLLFFSSAFRTVMGAICSMY